MSAFEKFAEEAKDDDTYDMEADEESEQLEGTLEREKSSEVKRKAACWKATEARKK